MESRWIYGVHVESIWNLWGSVKYSLRASPPSEGSPAFAMSPNTSATP